MKTDDLVKLLATGGVGVEPYATERRYATAVGWGAFGATLLMAIMLGVRPDIRKATLLLMFWIKLAFAAALAVAGLLTVLRLSRPGVRLRLVPIALMAPVLAMWLLAGFELFGATPLQREELIFGNTWEACPLNIAMLSVAPFIALIWAMKGLAPTQATLAGAASGLLAGAMGALVYALHCPEIAAPFLGIWYVAGMLIPTAVGALLGSRLLRW
jgi:hypothetical protein